jgi:hypothetical protein
MTDVISDARRSLAALIDDRWDAAVSLQRLCPGASTSAAPFADRVHVVRESALAALADLAAGNTDRAVSTLGAVLDNQYPPDRGPWSGTFRVTAEDRPPPDPAVEWLHYDPNWRQFLGTILAVVLDTYGGELTPDLRARIAAAVAGCVSGEPDGRIPRWYTNPNLMHAWLQGWVGRRTNDRDLLAAADSRAAAIMERVDRHGDVDEYNSPTYDGIDLVALGLWAGSSPTDVFATAGRAMLDRLGARISALYHPGLGAIAGPYIRTYGFGLDRHVALLGMAWAFAGERAALPSELGPATDHIHDLYFLPLVDVVADVVVPSLHPTAVLQPRRHEQRFRDTHAVSTLTSTAAIGVEHGRRSAFSRDQYAPLVAHWVDASGPTRWVGLMPGDATHVDATPAGPGGAEASLVPAFAGAGHELEIHVIGSDPPNLVGPDLRVAGGTVTFSRSPTVSAEAQALGGTRLTLSFPPSDRPVTATVSIPLSSPA